MARPLVGQSPAAGAWALLAAITLLPTMGCGFKIEKRDRQAEQAVVPLGFESPQAAFQWLREASKQEDFGAMMQGVTDQTAQVFAGHMLISGAMLQAAGKPSRQIRRVLSKHGIDDDALEKIQEKLALQISEPAAIYDLANPIKDKRSFVADMMEAFAKLGRRVPVNSFDADVEHWEIHEDQAIGLIEQDGKLERIAFLRNDLGWQIHFVVRRAVANELPVEGDDLEASAQTPPATPPQQSANEPKTADDAPTERPREESARLPPQESDAQ